MTISGENRKRFEGIGRDLIRNDLSTGRASYIGRRVQDRREAEEWIVLQDAEDQKRTNTSRYLRDVAITLGVIGAIAGLIALVK